MEHSAALIQVVIVYFIHKDGSKVRCRCTASESIIKSEGIRFRRLGLYDLDVKKRIPSDYLSLECEVYSEQEDVDSRCQLDKFLNDFVKNIW